MSEDSFTTSMTTLAEEYTADFQLDSFWLTALRGEAGSNNLECLLSLGIGWVRSATSEPPVLHDELVRDVARNEIDHVLSGS